MVNGPVARQVFNHEDFVAQILGDNFFILKQYFGSYAESVDSI